MRKFMNIISEASAEMEMAFRAHPFASQHFGSLDAFVEEMRSLDPTGRYVDWLCRAFLADCGEDGSCQGGDIIMDPNEIRHLLSRYDGDIEQFPTITAFVRQARTLTEFFMPDDGGGDGGESPNILVTDIDWDTEGEEVDDLPESIPMLIHGEDSEDIESQIADALSDNYSWCVNSFEWRYI